MILALKKPTFQYEDDIGLSTTCCLKLKSWRKSISVISLPPHDLLLTVQILTLDGL